MADSTSTAPRLQLFCDNDTNPRRLFGTNLAAGYFKDAFHEYLVHGKHDAVNPRTDRHQGRRAP